MSDNVFQLNLFAVPLSSEVEICRQLFPVGTAVILRDDYRPRRLTIWGHAEWQRGQTVVYVRELGTPWPPECVLASRIEAHP